MSSIYLDHAATTPMVEEALIAMTAQLARLGNPSSLHTHGRATRKTLEDAREVIAKEVGNASATTRRLYRNLVPELEFSTWNFYR